MAAENFDNCFNLTIGSEGGYGRNAKDRGDWTSGKIGVGELKGTKYGIAAMVYPTLDIEHLTLADAKAIYRRDYWPKVAGDSQPVGIDLVAWDICVNSGSARALQIERDALGSKLVNASSLASLAQTVADKAGVVKSMCARRASFYHSLSTFETFGKGWMARNAKMEVNGVRMALAADKVPPAEIKKKLDTSAAEANTSKKTNAGGATIGTGTAAGTAHQTTWTGMDWSDLFIGVLIVAGCVALTLYCFHWYRAHKAQAEAYAAAAAVTEG